MTLTSLVLFLFSPSLPFWTVLPSAFLLMFPHCFPHHHLTSSISCHASLRALGEHVCRTVACFWWESIYAVFVFYVTVFCRESWSYTQRTWHLSWFPLLDRIELSGRGNLSWKHALSGKPVVHFFNVGRCTLGKVVLSCIKMLGELPTMNKPVRHSSRVPTSVPALGFLFWVFGLIPLHEGL